jgi:fucose permease
LVLVSSSIGAVLGANLAGRLIHRFGSKPAIYWAIVIVPLGVVVMALSTTAWVLVVGLFVMGFGYAALDVGGNSQAVAIEKHLSKRYITSFHGMWSLGTLAATLFGGLVSHVLTPSENLLLVAGVGFIWFLFLVVRLLPVSLNGHQGDVEEKLAGSVPWLGLAVLPLLLMGIGAGVSFIAEGAAADWGALLLRDFMGVEKGFYATAFASFSVAMIISRFTGDRLLEKYGPYLVVRVMGVAGGLIWAMAMWLGIWLAEGLPLIALIIVNIGFFAAGLAIGPMAPAFILGAANLKGIAPSVGIARIGVISIGAYFVGPSVVGGLSDLVTLPFAMMYPALALVFAGYLARVLRVVSKA